MNIQNTSSHRTARARRTAALLSSSAILAALSSLPANAAGTLADSLVTNTVTVNYSVGGVAQTSVTATETFLVDKMVDVQVTATNSSVVPGQETAVLTYIVQNQGNATQGYALDVIYDPTTLSLSLSADATITSGEYGLFLDTNNNGIYDAGVDQFYSTVGNLNAGDLIADEQYTVFVVAYIPSDALDTQIAGFAVSATTLDAGTEVGAEGVVTTETLTPSIDSTDTVFADAAGNNDVAEDGKSTALGNFTVASANLLVSKTARVINKTGANCLTAIQDADAGELFTIPGACIEYTITVQNNGSEPASNVAIIDPLPTDITFAGFHSSTSTDFTSAQAGDAAPAFSAGTASATEADVLSGETINLVIRAIIK